jgi:hypothetical protein
VGLSISRLSLAFVLGLVFIGSVHGAAITIYNTGVCAGANNAIVSGCSAGLVDPGGFDNNWQYTVRGDGGLTGLNSSLVENPLSACCPPVSYIPADGLSQWLTPYPGGNFISPSIWDAQTTFDLTGFNPATLVLQLSVAADNLLSVNVNGHSVFTPACNTVPIGVPYCFQQFYSTTLNNAMVSGWLPGLNTIQIVITNNDNPSPSGFRVELSGNANGGVSAVPEPQTWSLLGAGLAGLALLRRRILV